MLTIFSQLSAISQMLLHPHFVFDGPNRPCFKQGKDCMYCTGAPLLKERFQELLDTFGFSWHTAPEEAEAELAYFQLHGLVDAVVMPYNDAFLFGAPSIIRSVQPLSGEYSKMELYTEDAIEHDYNMGLPGCTAAAMSLFVEFMGFHAKWHNDLFQVLKRDLQRHLGQCHYGLTRVLDEEHTNFPDPAILATYLLPLTLWSDGGQPPVTEVTSRQPNLAALSMFCQQSMGWPLDALQLRLMDVRVGAVVRALLQLPGEIDSLALQHGVHVMSYHDRSLPVYNISVPSHLLPAPPSDAAPSSSNTHMSLPSDHSSYDMKIPAVMLDSLWPDLAHSLSRSAGMESVGKNVRSTPEEGVIDLTVEAPCFDAEVIDLTGKD
ncbi:hypothetical protein SCLCIDRAFT_24650 [Scleroderma citrinum Foug A]|uniref:XPG-I domain-containing protein n=1 Tax=Scleroderma citrinum Foug A TaxID=1036808 RepID=A0A0C3DQ77_9AGAM|nr:hypothetical protein SCLCIDRAFT_24650 [Scleroderma citrinum Foug A]